MTPQDQGDINRLKQFLDEQIKAGREQVAAVKELSQSQRVFSANTVRTGVALGVLAVAAERAHQNLKSLALAASPGAFDPVRAGVQMLSATIGTVLLPAFTLLGAGVMTAADALWTELKPKLPELADAFAEAAASAVSFAEGMKSIIQGLRENLSWVMATPRGIRQAGEGIGDWIGKQLFGEIPEVGAGLRFGEQARANEAAARGEGGPGRFALPGGGGAGGGFDVGGAFKKNLGVLIASMQQAFGGGAGFSDLISKFRQVQQQSFLSPFEQELIKKQGEALDLLKQIDRKLGGVLAEARK